MRQLLQRSVIYVRFLYRRIQRCVFDIQLRFAEWWYGGIDCIPEKKIGRLLGEVQIDKNLINLATFSYALRDLFGRELATWTLGHALSIYIVHGEIDPAVRDLVEPIVTAEDPYRAFLDGLIETGDLLPHQLAFYKTEIDTLIQQSKA